MSKMSEAVLRFEQSLMDLWSFNPDDFGPSTLYHYTGAAGLKGILSKDSLWATNFSFLNDPSEVEYGRELVRQTLKEKKEADHSSTRNLLDEIDRCFAEQLPSEVYVSCFTELSDNLSQWRAYGAPKAPRYCIGFDAGGIENLALPPNKNMIFAKVEYQEREQRKKITRILDNAIEVIGEFSLAVKDVANAAAAHLARLLPQLKSLAYASEEESRLIRWIPDDVSEVCFDTARGVVRPYVVLEPAPKVVELFVLAPGQEEISIKAAEMLLRKRNIRDVKPKKSKVPFAE
jgi:hypothetical protein